MSALPSQRFQFTIGNLLAAMLWAALVAWGLASATDLAYSVLLLVMLVLMFTSIVACIYCRGRRRAFAVGFLVFSFGHWVCIWLTLKSTGSDYGSFPAIGVVAKLQEVLHGRAGLTQLYFILNFALTMLLGFLGGIIATLLYTEPRQTTGGTPSI